MKKATLLLLALLLLCGPTSAQDKTALPARGGHTGKITKAYDRFTDETSYALGLMLVAGSRFDGLHLHAYTRVAPPARATDAVLLGLTFVSPEDVRARDATLYAIVDGDRGALGEVGLLGSDRVGHVYSVAYGLKLKPDELRRLASARKVEMRFGGVGFELTEDHRKALLDFLAYASGK